MKFEVDSIKSCVPGLQPNCMLRLDLDLSQGQKIAMVQQIWEDLGTELFSELILEPENYTLVKTGHHG